MGATIEDASPRAEPSNSFCGFPCRCRKWNRGAPLGETVRQARKGAAGRPLPVASPNLLRSGTPVHPRGVLRAGLACATLGPLWRE